MGEVTGWPFFPCSSKTMPEDLKENKISLELALDVHGGVTFADKCVGNICHERTEPGDEEKRLAGGLDSIAATMPDLAPNAQQGIETLDGGNCIGILDRMSARRLRASRANLKRWQ